MRHLIHDLRVAARALLKTPAFLVVSILTLGLGIGATAAIYSLVKRVALDPLPYPAADRLVRLGSETTEGEWGVSRAQWVFYRERTRTIEELAGYRIGQASVQTGGGSERIGRWEGTASFFRLLGARARLGRIVDEQDDEYGATPVAVLSHAYWQTSFGADPSVIGRTISVDESPIEIVGVMEPLAELPEAVPVELMPDVWLPLQLNLAGQFWNSHMEFRTLARLAPGATAEDASRELTGYNAQLLEAFPQTYSATFMERYAFRPHATSLRNAIVGDVARNLWILLAGVGLVLAIACANIANLFLVRAEGRRREMALRTALGARRGAILRHFLAESLVITAGGLVLGVLFAHFGTRWLVAEAPTQLPRIANGGLDAGVIAFAALTAVFVALALALLPGARYSRALRSVADLGEGGRSSTVGRERQRVRGALVMAQVGLALVLLVGAGLLLESFRRLRAVDPGIDAAGVLSISIAMSPRYDTYEKRWLFSQQLLERVRALPGVSAAGIGPVPLNDSYGCTVQAFPDAEVMQRIADSNGTLCAGQSSVTDGYFDALGIPVLAGRALSRADNDNPDAGAVVVSRAFAEKFWPDENAIGKRVAPQGRSEGPFYTVVGVVGDVYGSSLSEPPAVAIYYPLVPIGPSGGLYNAGTLMVSVAGSDPMSIFPQVRSAVLALDPAIPLANPRSMETVVANSMSGLSFTMMLLGSAALAALVLAAIGLYGVLGYLVQRRTAEIGVRMALGATAAQVQRMVVGASLRLVLAGLLVGTALALALSRYLVSLLYEVQPTEPVTYVAAALLLAGVALAASWLPAYRAARVDPVQALRTE